MLLNCDVGEYLRVPWTARRSNQSVLKEISPEYSLEELMLKLQYFGHLMQRSDPDAGKDWRQEEKTTSEDEMVGWHHWLNGHEFEQALGVGDGQGSLACCSPWSRRESETTERLNWKETWVLLEDQQKFLGGRYYADKFCISSFHWYSFLKSTCLRKYLIFYRFSLFIYLSKNKSLISYPGECNYGALPFKVAKPFSHPEQGLFQKGGGVTNKGLRLKTWNQTFSQET